MNNNEIIKHVRGESQFIDDLKLPHDILYGTVLTSEIPHGKIEKIDLGNALSLKGVVQIIDHHDIPGENQIGAIIRDEELLSDGIVKFAGEPILLILSESLDSGREALKEIKVDISPIPAITDPRESFRAGNLIVPPRTFDYGDTDSAWEKCEVVAEGRVESGGQEHFYMETQASLAYPVEKDSVKVLSSTQSPTSVQKAVSGVLGIPMNRVEVDVRRLGGGFGGKEDQATPWAAMAALGAYITKRPVKIVLSRSDDIRNTGKRHPFSSDFKIGLDSSGKIVAYEATFYQNCGAYADLSTAILERALFHATNSYFIPNVRVTGISCYTNLPPFTAFRGFGGPQAMFVIESAISKAAAKINMNVRKIQKMNLLKEGDLFPYGMVTENCNIIATWEKLEEKFQVEETYKKIDEFNRKNDLIKKGAAVMPVSFGISFTNKMLNQAGALVHIYTDGSVSVSTGAVEMGQGVNKKMINVAAETLSIPPSRVRIETTNTTRVANTSPTAASSGADLNGMATRSACIGLVKRLRSVAAKSMGVDIDQIKFKSGKVFNIGNGQSILWEELIGIAYSERVSLTSQAYYATPDIYFDKTKEKGKPFAYHVFGTALIEAELDVLRGVYKFNRVSIVHDTGKSLDQQTDLGQIEGGFIQGLGWVTVEELLFEEGGKIITGGSSTYKVPDIKFIPDEINVEMMQDLKNPYAVLGSKAVGEPPFMYGIGGYFAVRKCLFAAKPDVQLNFDCPLTPEKIIISLM
ncbi:MAG: molybdopterin-dependent oxidoreductase [Candidatus Aminicenantes bacterium]|nr:molybdopterin-dependent oxidoreductase [Candidatus Aminicenantes bacterium]